jgi:signal transduction histidine kinase
MESAGIEDCRILVVDDERNMRDVISQILSYSGYDCTAVTNGEEALTYMRTHPVDVLITDIVMPGMDGIELTGRVKKEFDADIMVMTGYAKNYSFEEIIEKGANDFIEKPIRTNELIVRLKRIIKERSVLNDRNRVQAALVKSEGRLRALAVRLKETEENLRKELARELHDRVGQNLTALNLNLSGIRDKMPRDAVEKNGNLFEDSMKLIVETTDHIRDVMARLRPVGLDEYGLVSALNWYGKRFSTRTGIPVNVYDNGYEKRLSPSLETEFFRISQEALTNIAKHAKADRVDIFLTSRNDGVTLSISDNGTGFNMESVISESSRPGDRKTGWGLISMNERTNAVKGELRIDSIPGQGTTVEISVKR